MKTARIKLEPNQMYPYLALHPSLAGLIKYGAVKVPNQLPRKLAAVARPNVKGRSWLLGNSPPTSQA